MVGVPFPGPYAYVLILKRNDPCKWICSFKNTPVSEKFSFLDKVLLRYNYSRLLRTVPTIVTAHIFCVCQDRRAQPRATRKKCATRRTRGLVLSPLSLGLSSYFLWKRCVVFQRWKIISIYLVSSLKTEEVCACCYFCRMVDLTKHFIVKQKSILKHQKLLFQDVTLGAWVLNNPLIGKDQ